MSKQLQKTIHAGKNVALGLVNRQEFRLPHREKRRYTYGSIGQFCLPFRRATTATPKTLE